MSTNETLETLLRLGGLLKDAIAKSTEGGRKFDWKTFLESDEYGEIETDVKTLLSHLSAGDLTKAIAEIKAKEQALLGGRRLAELETDKLIQYSQLQNTRLVLAARKVASEGGADLLRVGRGRSLPRAAVFGQGGAAPGSLGPAGDHHFMSRKSRSRRLESSPSKSMGLISAQTTKGLRS